MDPETNLALNGKLEPVSPSSRPDATAPPPPPQNDDARTANTIATEWNGGAAFDALVEVAGDEARPPKKKQKRNKPTLSCVECVDRKTKCDRGRPHCLACVKRQSMCHYAQVANVIEETSRSMNSARRMTKPPKRRLPSTSTSSTLCNETPSPSQPPAFQERNLSVTSTASSILLSDVPYSQPSASNVFGIGSEHPFANYWTCQGGLAETISVLPGKYQADVLLERYFECVDPVYPMLHRQTFYAEFEHFFSLPPDQKNTSDASLVALIFTMLAMGTQFVTTTTPKDRQQTAEFYVSAAHQSLRMSSYLNKASIRSLQAMVLITYFLINDNHASDGWAFAGILIKQAYAMNLHRDPNIVCPSATIFEKQMRRKLWQAVLLQDTFLTVLLSLPPSATHTDVNVDDLIDDSSSIAHSNPTDTAYIRGCWTLANLVQDAICSPRSLGLPIATTQRGRTKLVADFRSVYRSFPEVFRSWDEEGLRGMCAGVGGGGGVSGMEGGDGGSKRVVRQTLWLTSNYYHNVMLLHSSECPPEVRVNGRAAIEAASEAIGAFFLLWELFESEAKVWWVFNHRAFLEALCIGTILRETLQEPNGTEIVNSDPVYIRGKKDIARTLQIMQIIADSEDEHGAEVARMRLGVLGGYV